MNDHSIVGQLKAEIVDLEKAVQQLDQRKKQVKAEIRARKRARKFLNSSGSLHDTEDLSSL